MNQEKRTFCILAILFFIAGCLAISIFTGCQIINERIFRPARNSEAMQLESAIKEYEKGNYQEASENFRSILENTADPSLKKTALKGLACSRYILAQTRQEFEIVRELGRKWQKMPGRDYSDEKCRMLGPVLEKWASTVNCDPSREQTAAGAAIAFLSNPEDIIAVEPGYSEALENATEKNAELLKRLGEKEEKIRSLEQQVSRMEKDMRLLKEQIAALEEIHQDINKKKKGIQNP